MLDAAGFSSTTAPSRRNSAMRSCVWCSASTARSVSGSTNAAGCASCRLASEPSSSSIATRVMLTVVGLPFG